MDTLLPTVSDAWHHTHLPFLDSRRCFMHNAIPLILALIAVGSLLSVVPTLYVLNESYEHLV